MRFRQKWQMPDEGFRQNVDINLHGVATGNSLVRILRCGDFCMSSGIGGYGQGFQIKEEPNAVKQEPAEERPRSPFSATITMGQRFELQAQGADPIGMGFRPARIKAPAGSTQKTTTEHRTSSLRTSDLIILRQKGVDYTQWQKPPQSV